MRLAILCRYYHRLTPVAKEISALRALLHGRLYVELPRVDIPNIMPIMPTKKTKPAAKKSKNPVLLAGGNPQIAKADGDAPVQAYIAAIPGWKSAIAAKLDALITRTVPGVRKAVKWNSPFYGVAGQGWFASFHVFTRYVKLSFFRGASLQPLPPGPSKQKEVRYLDIHEDDKLDEKQLTSWIKQAAAIPGWLA